MISSSVITRATTFLLKTSAASLSRRKSYFLLRFGGFNYRALIFYFHRKNINNNGGRSPPNIFRLYRFADGNDLALVGIGSLLAILHGASMPALGLVFGQMTNTILMQHETSDTRNVSKTEENSNSTLGQESTWMGSNIATNLPQFTLYYTYIGVIVLATSFAQSYCWDLSCARQIYKLRRNLFRQILRQDIAWFERQGDASLTSQLFDDLERVRDGIGNKMSLLIQHCSAFICGVGVGLYVNLKLTFFIVAIAPVLVGCAALAAKVASSSAGREHLKYAKADAVADEVINNIKTVQAFGRESTEIERYSDEMGKGLREVIATYYRIAAAYVAYFLILYASYGGTLYIGALLINRGEATPGAVFTVLMSAMGGALQLGGSLPFFNAVSTAIGSAGTLFKTIDRVPLIDAYKEDGMRLTSVKGHIRFKHVSFRYNSRPSVSVLHELSLVIEPGQTVAVVGSSGSGKSTVFSLLLRFYDPVKGKVFLDNVSLKELNLKWLRSQIGLVSQEPVLFATSIRQNIQYGGEDVTDEEIISAAKLANAHDFIEELPMKYETHVGDRGIQLSGGQKQRIAIARALVRNPKILLLDEATSALDSQSEAEVQEALNRAMQGRTTIIIAHRLSTIKTAQVIFLMKGGHLAEWGSHKDLMMKRGLYFNRVVAEKFRHQYETVKSKKDAGGIIQKEVKIKQENSIDLTLRQQIRNEPSPDVPISRLITASLPEWPWLISTSFGFISNGCITPVFAILYGQVFSSFQLKDDNLLSAASFWALMFVALGIAAGVSQFVMLVSTVNAAERFIFRLRQLAFRNILRQDVGWFDLDEHAAGKLTAKLARDAPLIKQITALRAGQMMSAFTTLAFAIILALIQGWQLALLLLVAGPIVAMASYQEMRLVRQNLKRDSTLGIKAGNIAAEAIQNAKTVQALGREGTFADMHHRFLEQPFREAGNQAVRHATVFALSQSTTFLLYASAFRFGAYLIETEAMTPAQVYKTFFVIAFSSVSIGQFAVYTQDIARAKLSAGLIFQLIDTKTEIDAFAEGGIKETVLGNVSFRNIHFRYPARPEVEILKGVNLEIAAGQTVAIVGASGGGKSTLVSLLLRFYDPSLGSISVDDTEISEINLGHLRRNIGFVAQEPVLFSCSIAANIAYGEDKVDMAAVVEAAKTANIHNFIVSLPQGYYTVLRGGGSQLSGGQKQRLGIARALLRNPKILILDEATSALDTESEQIVQAALEMARNGRTCIIIANRLSTVENADKIAVLNNGIIAEEGTHLELMSKGRLYYNLVKKQREK